MKCKKRKTLALLLSLFGGAVTAFGAFLLILSIQMLLEDSDPSNRTGFLILIALLLVVVFFLGILPLRKGIHLFRHSGESKAKKPSAENASATQSVPPEQEYIPDDWSEQTEHRILCRDKQFDRGDLPLVQLLLKCIFTCAVPLLLAFYIYYLISKSADYHIQPGTVQAYGSLLVVVLGAVLSMLGLYFCGKYQAIGNKFLYYIIDDIDGLYYAHVGLGALSVYVKRQVPLSEKIKASPSPLYALLYAMGRQSRSSALRLAKMQVYFKLNQKYHFAEQALLGENYTAYCQKIAAVRGIRYFSGGCEVTFIVLQDGVSREVKQFIYRRTTNYELLLNAFKKLSPEVRQGDELSALQMQQVRRNIYRRAGISVLGIGCLALIMGLSYLTYLSVGHQAELLQDGFFRSAKMVLAGRAKRRIYRAAVGCVLLLLVPLGRLLIDLVRTRNFTCVLAEEVQYKQPGGSVLRRLGKDYPCLAKVKYGDGIIEVGLSREMWKHRKTAKPLLVLRNNVPYCLIDGQSFQ